VRANAGDFAFGFFLDHEKGCRGRRNSFVIIVSQTLTGAPAIHEPRGTPSSVVMQALGSRAAFATPSAKLTARPTARKVRPFYGTGLG
jgi:hypothetical protein|tara:strand:- start:5085 stop:5348 length:264 start_codon:yes stop_codon:yes gene_type:complete